MRGVTSNRSTRFIFRTIIAAAAMMLSAAFSAPIVAQSVASAGLQVVVAPAYQTWRLGKGVTLDSLLVHGATQVSVPFALQFPLHPRWTASISGAASASTLDATGTGGKASRSFSGLSDLRVRATGRIIGDALQLTVGVNVPTGAVALSAEQNDVQRVIAAPALDAQVPIAGTGLGGTVGLIATHNIGGWAFALGAGVEQRGRYAPLDAQIAGLDARTELVPGSALHFSLGADGIVGAHRLSLGVVTDTYGTDRVRLVSAGAEVRSQHYQLGPTVSAAALLQLSNPRIRDFTLRLNNRYRSGFKDDKGVEVDGSSGNYFELGGAGLVGAAGTRSLVLGLEVRQHTGLPVDPGIIGAKLTAVGATIGLSLPASGLEWRPLIRVSAGSLTTTGVSTSITGVTVGLTVNTR